jgi:hypothetical protein
LKSRKTEFYLKRMLNKSTIGLFVFVLSAITIAFGEVAYFDSYVSECYEGSVTLTKDNIDLLKDVEVGSCLEFGLKITKCPNTTYGCFVTSTRPSTAPEIGDTLMFGCGEHKKCDELPGYNCCPYDNCNCNEVYECESENDDDIVSNTSPIRGAGDRKRRDVGGNGASSSNVSYFD